MSFDFNYKAAATESVVEETVVEPIVEAVEEAVTPVVEEVAPIVEKPKHIKAEKKSDSIVVYALRDLSREGCVDLKKGYNTIEKHHHSAWLDHKAVRVASQEEIEKYVK